MSKVYDMGKKRQRPVIGKMSWRSWGAFVLGVGVYLYLQAFKEGGYGTLCTEGRGTHVPMHSTRVDVIQ